MNKHPDNEAGVEAETPNLSGVDQGRRKLGTLGVSGTAVLLSLPSKSAVAGWGSCTGSELMSGNLSKAGTANPCGCSPGFWWNNNGTALRNSAPTLAPFPFSTNFNTYFGRIFLVDPNTTFQNCGPSANPANTKNVPRSIAMHAIAALLNAAYYGTRYGQATGGLNTAAAVKTAFQAAFDGGSTSLNNFLTRVDIYGKTVDLWCNGARE